MSKTEGKTDGRPSVCLASGSPQRRAILEELGIAYQLLAVDVDEIVAATPRETVEENAARKLFEGLRIADRGAVVIAADTVLEAQGQVLGKPADEATAVRYLQILSGGSATAYSAVAVAVTDAAEGCLATETAEVHFRILPPEVIRWYVSTGEPMGRAGAFGISRLGEVLTESIDGCYSCIAGLPKTALISALAHVADEQVPQSLRNMPASIIGTRVRLRSLAVPS
jgi:septum formation protein